MNTASNAMNLRMCLHYIVCLVGCHRQQSLQRQQMQIKVSGFQSSISFPQDDPFSQLRCLSLQCLLYLCRCDIP